MASFSLAKYFLFSSRLWCWGANTHPQTSRGKRDISFGLEYQRSDSKGKKQDGVTCSAGAAMLETPSQQKMISKALRISSYNK